MIGHLYVIAGAALMLLLLFVGVFGHHWVRPGRSWFGDIKHYYDEDIYDRDTAFRTDADKQGPFRD